MPPKITIKDIATNLGLSPTTVSFVLNGRDKGISRQTADKIYAKAMELGYSRTTRLNMRNWIRAAYIVPNIADMSKYTTFYQNVYNHLLGMGEAAEVEFIIREFQLQASPSSIFRQQDNLFRQDIDVFFTSSTEIAESLLNKNCRTVLIQSGRQLDNCICIYCDDEQAGRLSAEHAIEAGYREAGTIFFNNDEDNRRYRGFISRFTELGGTCDQSFRWYKSGTHKEIENYLIEQIKSYQSLPALFYCFADNLVFPAIRAFAACGHAVPEDISLIGTDNLYWGSISAPAFTTVDLQEDIFAEKTMQAIKDASKGNAPYHLAVPVKFLRRDTLRHINIL